MIAIDSSSLILSAKLSILNVLIENIKHKLVITEQVYGECSAKRESFDAQLIEKLVKERLIAKKSISNRNLYNEILKDFNLGKGEAETITLCIELKSGIITDDKKAINACRILKIKFITAPRLLERLYNKKLLTKTEIDSKIKMLQKFGRYSEDIINKLKEDLK